MSPPRANGGSKLHKFFGDEYTKTVSTEPAPKTVPANLQPWYLRPNYSPSEIIIDPDGSVRGGTVPALVERLTAHEHGGNVMTATCNFFLIVLYRPDLHQGLLDDI